MGKYNKLLVIGNHREEQRERERKRERERGERFDCYHVRARSNTNISMDIDNGCYSKTSEGNHYCAKKSR